MTENAVPVGEKGYQAESGPWGLVDELEKTPELQWPRNIEIYDSMRRQDAQVISVLRAVTLPIRRTTWRVDPAGCRPEVAKMVAEDLGLPLLGQDTAKPARTRGRFSWAEHLRMALLMLTFGHSYFEQVYQIDDAGLARLRKLAWRPPRTISKIDVASDGGLVAIEQDAVGGQKAPRIPVDRLVAYVADREGGNWLGQSLLRPAYKFWLLKDRLLRVQAQTVDRNGMGVPVYTASELPDGVGNADDAKRRQQDEIEAGLKIARGFRSGDTAGAALPNGASIELMGVKGQLPNADEPIRYYDEQIARAVLAHFLNLGTETGSWALGSTFADFFTMSLQTVGKDIADTATQHVVEDMVDLNFGPDEPAPRIVFDEIGGRHPATAEAIRALVECGALVADDELEKYLRQTYGLPSPDAGSTREKPSQAAAVGDNQQRGGGNGSNSAQHQR